MIVRCPVCRSTDLEVTLEAARCTVCDHGWPVDQLTLPIDEGTPPRRTDVDALSAMRTSSARARWRATGRARP